MTTEVERHEGNAFADPLGHHCHDLDLAAFRTFDPDLRAVPNTNVVGITWIDFDEHVLLKLGKPRVRPCLVTAALILDQTAGGQDDRVIREKSCFWIDA
jgi:hypothetical protein